MLQRVHILVFRPELYHLLVQTHGLLIAPLVHGHALSLRHAFHPFRPGTRQRVHAYAIRELRQVQTTNGNTLHAHTCVLRQAPQLLQLQTVNSIQQHATGYAT